MEEFEYYEEPKQGFIRRNIVDFTSTLMSATVVVALVVLAG